MKKRLLFVIQKLNCGGVEKALINLFNQIDRDHYDCELLVIENKGDFKEFIPKWVKIHEYNAPTHVKEMLEKLTNVKLAKKDKLNVKVSKVYWKLVYIAYKVARKFLRKNILYKAAFHKYKKNNIYDGYDAIIDFHGYGAYTTYLAAYMGKNVKRISWIHEQNIYMPYHLIAKCYKNFDHIFGCSKDCCDNFIDVFPKTKDYVSVYYNYLDVDEIKKKSTEKIDDICLRKDNVFKIVSVGRVSKQKAFARVVDCAKILKDSGYEFYWNVIGDGEQLYELRKKVEQLALNEYVNFVGYCTNPYPYIKQADLYVQTSVAEGYCTTISEAIILGKAVVTTDVSGAREQLEDEKGGVIVEHFAKEIAAAIEDLILDKEKLQRMSKYNRQKNMNFEKEIDKLYQQIG